MAGLLGAHRAADDQPLEHPRQQRHERAQYDRRRRCRRTAGRVALHAALCSVALAGVALGGARLRRRALATCGREMCPRAHRDHGLRPGRHRRSRSSLVRLEHSVAVIDQDPLAFRRLGDDFPGRQITGVGFDRDTLMSRPGSRRPTRSPRSAAATTRTSSPRGWPARRSASSRSSPASTTRSAPRSTSGSASLPSRPCLGRPSRLLKSVLGETTAEAWRDPSGAVALTARRPARGLGRAADHRVRGGDRRPGRAAHPVRHRGAADCRRPSSSPATRCTSSSPTSTPTPLARGRRRSRRKGRSR